MDSVILDPEEPPPVEIAHGEGAAPVLLACDHASPSVPRSLANLGLDETVLAQHVGWDIGAAAVTRELARLLDAPAILTAYSRLVIDCNRSTDNPTSIPETSDDITIPGNQGLSAEARGLRINTFFRPYHAAIERSLDEFVVRHIHPALLSIHSFTPVMKNHSRPWQVGILWDKDPRIPLPLMAALARDPDLVVGDNLPYSAREPEGYTIRTHAVGRGLPHVAIEIRQDLIAEFGGAKHWAERLRAALAPILGNPQLYRVKHF